MMNEENKEIKTKEEMLESVCEDTDGRYCGTLPMCIGCMFNPKNTY